MLKLPRQHMTILYAVLVLLHIANPSFLQTIPKLLKPHLLECSIQAAGKRFDCGRVAAWPLAVNRRIGASRVLSDRPTDKCVSTPYNRKPLRHALSFGCRNPLLYQLALPLWKTVNKSTVLRILTNVNVGVRSISPRIL